MAIFVRVILEFGHILHGTIFVAFKTLSIRTRQLNSYIIFTCKGNVYSVIFSFLFWRYHQQFVRNMMIESLGVAIP